MTSIYETVKVEKPTLEVSDTEGNSRRLGSRISKTGMTPGSRHE